MGRRPAPQAPRQRGKLGGYIAEKDRKCKRCNGPLPCISCAREVRAERLRAGYIPKDDGPELAFDSATLTAVIDLRLNGFTNEDGYHEPWTEEVCQQRAVGACATAAQRRYEQSAGRVETALITQREGYKWKENDHPPTSA